MSMDSSTQAQEETLETSISTSTCFGNAKSASSAVSTVAMPMEVTTGPSLESSRSLALRYPQVSTNLLFSTPFQQLQQSQGSTFSTSNDGQMYLQALIHKIYYGAQSVSNLMQQINVELGLANQVLAPPAPNLQSLFLLEDGTAAQQQQQQDPVVSNLYQIEASLLQQVQGNSDAIERHQSSPEVQFSEQSFLAMMGAALDQQATARASPSMRENIEAPSLLPSYSASSMSSASSMPSPQPMPSTSMDRQPSAADQDQQFIVPPVLLENGSYWCKKCGRKYGRQQDYKRHWRGSAHNNEKHYCTACGRDFTRKDTMARHRRSSCPKCKKTICKTRRNAQ